MSKICIICKSDKRLKIDRAIVKGRGYTNISLKYKVPMMSVYNHAKKHLSRQMVKSNEMQELTASTNLFHEINELITRTKNILSDAERQEIPTISLQAIRELRKTYEFLIKFQVYMQQAQKQDKEDEMRNAKWEVAIIRERLNPEELGLLNKLMQKMNGELDKDTEILKEAKISTYDRYNISDTPEDDDVEDDKDDVEVIDLVPVKMKKKKKKSKLMKRKKKKKHKVEDDEEGDEEGDKVKQVSRKRRRLNKEVMFPNHDDGSINVL